MEYLKELLPVAIDPANCGCTECIVSEYRPLHRANAFEVLMMLNGKIANNLYASNVRIDVQNPTQENMTVTVTVADNETEYFKFEAKQPMAILTLEDNATSLAPLDLVVV